MWGAGKVKRLRENVRSRREGKEADNWKEAEDKDRRTTKVDVTLIFQDSTSAAFRFDSRLAVTVKGLCPSLLWPRGGSGGGIERNEGAGRIVKRERFVWHESPPIYTLSGLHLSSAAAAVSPLGAGKRYSAATTAVVSPGFKSHL